MKAYPIKTCLNCSSRFVHEENKSKDGCYLRSTKKMTNKTEWKGSFPKWCPLPNYKFDEKLARQID